MFSPALADRLIEAAAMIIALATIKVMDRRHGKRRDAGLQGGFKQVTEKIETVDQRIDEQMVALDRKLDDRCNTLDRSLDERCTVIERSVEKVSALVIGADGQNGVRGDVREIRARVIGLENRERERP